MKTPLDGEPELATLDLADHNVCRQILSLDKHTLVEGLVFETYFQNYLDSLPGASSDRVKLVDVDTAVVRLPKNSPERQNGNEFAAFVWVRSRGEGLGRYLEALESRMPVWFVTYRESEGEFRAERIRNGKREESETPRLLQTVASEVAASSEPRVPDISRDVRNDNRINQSFWGYLSERHGDWLGFNVVLPRIFFNWGIQPWFDHVWNVDRVFLHENQLWHFEVKHKFPMIREEGLAFGINDGELKLMQTLTNCGLRSMHTLVVKPYWHKEVGSMYLQNDPQARKSAAIIGRQMTRDGVERALQGRGSQSGADTSFSGKNPVSYRKFPAETFHRFGVLANDTEYVGERIFSHMASNDQPLCADSDLYRLRLD